MYHLKCAERPQQLIQQQQSRAAGIAMCGECCRPAEERNHAQLPHTESDGPCWRDAGGTEVITREAGSEGAESVKELWPAWSRLTCGWVTAWVSLQGKCDGHGAASGKQRRGKACGSEWFSLGVSSGAGRAGYTGCSSSDRAQGMEGIHVPASAGCWALVCSWLTKTYWLKLSSEMLLAGKIS